MTNILSTDIKDFLTLLENRFEKNKTRHSHMDWEQINNKLLANPEKIAVIHQMEATGGEPDVVFMEEWKDAILYIDCATESPKERRSLCYDRAALDARKEAKPKNSALDMAKEIGIELLDEAMYLKLQALGDFDLKTSSWLKTPDSIRQLKGAIFGDKRYNHTFIYHNGAESYYAARGFRGFIVL